MEDDELLVPLAALEHWSYCHRQCGLIHLENLWAESVRTVEGHQLHEKVDLPGLEQRPGMRVARALQLRSDVHHLVGRADAVVFWEDPAWPDTGRPFPVEYKRSSRNTFRHAELQLCAQALCLEEMLGVPVPAGAIFYGASRRRREVVFDQALRDETLQAVRGVLEMLQSARTPPPELGPKCPECSLQELCMPGLPGIGGLRAYLRGMD
ncbi:MAG: CRISPR-associated protein Cas4 [Holophagaceae bacterium]|nr:CRISPR-associated protein Cas4 [Holophagaceae bacterium]